MQHREDGPAAEYKNGDKEWFICGGKHREGAPAVEYADGGKEWWLDDMLHREDGPAIELADGTKEWWINHVQLTEEEFNHWRMKQDLNAKLHVTLASRFKEKLVKL